MLKISRLVSIIFPPRCPICSVIVSEDGKVCSNCWHGLKFISSPSCVKCDYPFEFEISHELLCAKCLEGEWYFDQAMSILKYNDSSKDIVHKLKFADRTNIAKQCAILISKKITKNYDFIIPVPMHRNRLLKRFYNQSALIADHLGKIVGIEVLHNGLIKTKKHDPQTGLSKQARKTNVAGSFVINPRHATELKVAKVLLIDDVFTTGSTVNECSRVLKRAKVAEVTVCTLARVV